MAQTVLFVTSLRPEDYAVHVSEDFNSFYLEVRTETILASSDCCCCGRAPSQAAVAERENRRSCWCCLDGTSTYI